MGKKTDYLKKIYSHYRETLANFLTESIQNNNIELFVEIYETYFDDAYTDIDFYINIAERENKKEILEYLLILKDEYETDEEYDSEEYEIDEEYDSEEEYVEDEEYENKEEEYKTDLQDMKNEIKEEKEEKPNKVKICKLQSPMKKRTQED